MADRRKICQERHVRRSGHDHGRSRGRILPHRDAESRHHIRHRVHTLRVDRPAVLVLHPRGGGLSEFCSLRGRQVAEVLVIDRAVQRVGDLGRDPEVHLCHPRADPTGMQAPLAALRTIEVHSGARIERMRRTVVRHGLLPGRIRPIYGRARAGAGQISVRDDAGGVGSRLQRSQLRKIQPIRRRAGRGRL